MQTKKISLIIIIFLAIAVGFGVYKALDMKKTTVYVFNADYKAGTQITPDMLNEMLLDSSIVEAALINRTSPEDAIYITESNLDQALGNYLKYDVFKGTIFMSNYVDIKGGSAAEINLGANMVGVTVTADNISGVTPEISKDSRVNVYAGFEMDGNIRYTVLLLENIRVIDVQINTEDNGTPQIVGITLEVNPEQAMKLNFAQMFGTIRFGTVKPGQYEPTDVVPVTMDDIVRVDTVTAPQPAVN